MAWLKIPVFLMPETNCTADRLACSAVLMLRTPVRLSADRLVSTLVWQVFCLGELVSCRHR
eukprot:5218450-Prymnesium_polylepis.1